MINRDSMCSGEKAKIMLCDPRVVLLSIMSLAVSCGTATTLAGRSVVLPLEQAEQVLQTCSRAAPHNVEATWVVTPEVVDRLEANLGKLARIRAKECCILHARLRDPGTYFRQYVGIVIGGQRLVYINAFRFATDHDEWRDRAVGACDGGDDYWGAVYNPETEEFSQLAFNGFA